MRKLYGDESLDPSQDYWELDPALPSSDLLTIYWMVEVNFWLGNSGVPCIEFLL